MAEIVDASATLRVLEAVDDERQRQDAKWGEQNHHPFLWLAVLGEEVGEANQSALQVTFGGKTWADYRKELIEVAAVAVAMVECLDRHGGAPPPASAAEAELSTARAEVERLRKTLSLIQEMAAEDLRTDRVWPRSSTWQIEADARAALAQSTPPGN